MGAIKDLVDLADKLNTSIMDRKTRELLLPLKEAATEAQREIFYAERKHAEEMDKLKAENTTLRAQIDQQPKAEFFPKTGTWIESSTGIHYCPRCRQNGKWSPMQTAKYGWSCPSCDKYAEDPANPGPTSLPPNYDRGTRIL